jgi:hypothetical protein
MNPLQRSVTAFSIGAFIFTGCLLPSRAIAQSVIQFNPPSSGAPGNRESGSARGECVNTAELDPNSRGLTALLPTSNLGLTTQDYPSFFAYVPEIGAGRVDFVLYEGESPEGAVDPVYTASIPASGQSGIVEVVLPDDGSVPPLSVGKSYVWFFAISCESGRGGDVVVQGYTERLDADVALTTQLQGKSPQEQAAVYASEGIWLDALTALALAWQQESANESPPEAWVSLLEAVELNDITDEPLLLPAAPSDQ